MRGYLVAAATLLAAGSAAAGLARAGETEVNTAAPGDKAICKSHDEIGSLVKRRKVCRTAAQWDRVARAARSTGRTMQESGMGKMSANE